MARARRSDDEDSVRERPAWIFPALVILAIAAFSGLFLYYYFGPTPHELLGLAPSASSKTEKVRATIGDTSLLIPENYTRYPAQRSGGKLPAIDLHALLPKFEPFSPDRQEEFSNNAPDSPVIYFTLREAGTTLDAERRLREVYSNQFENPRAKPGPEGLDLFRFKANSGYKDQDLLVGVDSAGRLALLICERETPTTESPNCSRTMLLTPKLALIYRYKRAHIEDWNQIDRQVTELIKTFEMANQPKVLLQGTITE